MKIPTKEIKKWCSELRSGKWKQGRGSLQHRGHCCLGVACEVFIPEKLKKRCYMGKLLGGNPLHQPNSPEWLKELPEDFLISTEEDLTSLNDYHRFTFDEIADLLEAVYVHKVLG